MKRAWGSRGSTLLDAVVGTALMLVVFVGIVGAFRLAVESVGNNKARAGAIALANERLEYVRSLQYASVGTVGGIPSGALPQSETITLNDVTYTRRTFVSYEDDPMDGSGGADSNAIVTDYKAAKIAVSWNSRQGVRTITMTTRLSPPTGIEVAVPGGTIVVHAVDATFQPISNVEVRVTNAGLTPAVDLTTYTDALGTATILGAPAGAGYAVTVTKAGYSTARTYGASATNTNPLPAHLGVALYQTTAATFEIDLVSTLTIATYEAPEEEVWQDTFSSGTNIATTSDVVVGGGVVTLEEVSDEYAEEGWLISGLISDPYLSRWKEFSWSQVVPAGTNIVYRVYDSQSNPVPNNDLPGNGAGFTTSPINLTALSTTTYSSLRIGATLTTSDASTTPRINEWAVSYDVGPEPLPNLDFAMHGAKTIGTGGDGSLIYKYENDALQTNAQGTLQLDAMEWDVYTMTVAASTGYDISSSCAPQPVILGPGSSVTTALQLSPHTTHSLLVDVRTSTGAPINGASVHLSRGALNTTIVSDQCGNVFFSGLSSGTVGSGNPYAIEVSASGYTSFTSSEVNISGTTRLSVILN